MNKVSAKAKRHANIPMLGMLVEKMIIKTKFALFPTIKNIAAKGSRMRTAIGMRRSAFFQSVICIPFQ
jgi:hypothetical protein